MFAVAGSIARGMGQAALAALAAVSVSLICLAALLFALICAAPLHKLRA
ncbi:MAG TPA: hypothetical protein VK515_01210 [Rhizomicrobium sp.]|nr:hypothetical protein [Rhizomicrobium sp.]